MFVMKFEDIVNEWERDAKMDNTELGTESLRIPLLHHKYFKILSSEALQLRNLERSYKQLHRTKFEYYTGVLSQEELKEYGWEPWGLKILKGDLSLYIESDPDLQQLDAKIDIQKQKLTFVESIVKTVVNRGFLIKNAIDWERFKNGG
jgi:hypothetical protein